MLVLDRYGPISATCNKSYNIWTKIIIIHNNRETTLLLMRGYSVCIHRKSEVLPWFESNVKQIYMYMCV